MIFQKNSTRTRFSFDAAMRQLGGASIIATAADMQLGRGETIEDTARVLSRMVDAVMIRANRHDDVERFAAAADRAGDQRPDRHGAIPARSSPTCMTFEEHRGPVAGRTLAWVGDGNNVCASFIHAAGQLGFELTIACPDAYRPDRVRPGPRRRAPAPGSRSTDDPREAVAGADCVITDTWVSMGDIDHDARLKALEPYQVDARADGPGRARRPVPALPARPPRRGGHRRGASTARNRWSGTRRKTASTPRRRSWPGASEGRGAGGPHQLANPTTLPPLLSELGDASATPSPAGEARLRGILR